MRLSLVLFPLAFAACSTFGSNGSDTPVASGGEDAGVASGDASAEASAPSAAPVFVGSRTLTFTAPPLTVLSPAGVRPDDVLVSAWLGGPSTVQRLPPDWIELGRTSLGDSNNGGITTLLVGYHVLGATESDETSYAFDGSNGQIATVAYRGANRKQPFTPVAVTAIQTAALGGGLAGLDVPAFDTRAVSVPLYVFAIVGSTTFPVVPDIDRLEATGSLAAYRAKAAVAASVTVPGPHLEFTVAGAAPKVIVASLAVAAP